jgi:hypothetical protein
MMILASALGMRETKDPEIMENIMKTCGKLQLIRKQISLVLLLSMNGTKVRIKIFLKEFVNFIQELKSNQLSRKLSEDFSILTFFPFNQKSILNSLRFTSINGCNKKFHEFSISGNRSFGSKKSHEERSSL